MNWAVFKQRRAALLAAMPDNSTALLKAAAEQNRSNDTDYPFRQNSNFWYYTGFNEPDALLILVKEADGQSHQILLCRDKDPLAEVWQGRRLGPAKAAELMQLQSMSLSGQADCLQQALAGRDYLLFLQGEQPEFDTQVFAAIAALRQVKRGKPVPAVHIDLRTICHEQRLIKTEYELSLMRRAGQISALAHCRAMRSSKAGRFEYQLEADILHQFAEMGARYPAYNTIVGSGENGCILHYTENSKALKNGELVLIDAGCELEGYAADISRTFPVNGRFSAEQAAVYQLVLDSQYAACAEVKPGSDWGRVTAAAERVLTAGLLKLGILQGDLTQLLEQKACKRYFIHGIGHWLGLDVHDAGLYKINNDDRPFEPGMVMTIEPGLYIPAGSDTDPKWWDLAVRIEDNLLVTTSGHENLTLAVPKDIADIEALMAVPA